MESVEGKKKGNVLRNTNTRGQRASDLIGGGRPRGEEDVGKAKGREVTGLNTQPKELGPQKIQIRI